MLRRRRGGAALGHELVELGLVLGHAQAVIDVEDTKVHCRIRLPGMLALFAAPIEAMLKAKGGDLLLEDKRD